AKVNEFTKKPDYLIKEIRVNGIVVTNGFVSGDTEYISAPLKQGEKNTIIEVIAVQLVNVEFIVALDELLNTNTDITLQGTYIALDGTAQEINITKVSQFLVPYGTNITLKAINKNASGVKIGQFVGWYLNNGKSIPLSTTPILNQNVDPTHGSIENENLKISVQGIITKNTDAKISVIAKFTNQSVMPVNYRQPTNMCVKEMIINADGSVSFTNDLPLETYLNKETKIYYVFDKEGNPTEIGNNYSYTAKEVNSYRFIGYYQDIRSNESNYMSITNDTVFTQRDNDNKYINMIAVFVKVHTLTLTLPTALTSLGTTYEYMSSNANIINYTSCERNVKARLTANNTATLTKQKQETKTILINLNNGIIGSYVDTTMSTISKILVNNTTSSLKLTIESKLEDGTIDVDLTVSSTIAGFASGDYLKGTTVKLFASTITTTYRFLYFLLDNGTKIYGTDELGNAVTTPPAQGTVITTYYEFKLESDTLITAIFEKIPATPDPEAPVDNSVDINITIDSVTYPVFKNVTEKYQMGEVVNFATITAGLGKAYNGKKIYVNGIPTTEESYNSLVTLTSNSYEIIITQILNEKVNLKLIGSGSVTINGKEYISTTNATYNFELLPHTSYLIGNSGAYSIIKSIQLDNLLSSNTINLKPTQTPHELVIEFSDLMSSFKLVMPWEVSKSETLVMIKNLIKGLELEESDITIDNTLITITFKKEKMQDAQITIYKYGQDIITGGNQTPPVFDDKHHAVIGNQNYLHLSTSYTCLSSEEVIMVGTAITIPLSSVISIVYKAVKVFALEIGTNSNSSNNVGTITGNSKVEITVTIDGDVESRRYLVTTNNTTPISINDIKIGSSVKIEITYTAYSGHLSEQWSLIELPKSINGFYTFARGSSASVETEPTFSKDNMDAYFEQTKYNVLKTLAHDTLNENDSATMTYSYYASDSKNLLANVFKLTKQNNIIFENMMNPHGNNTTFTDDKGKFNENYIVNRVDDNNFNGYLNNYQEITTKFEIDSKTGYYYKVIFVKSTKDKTIIKLKYNPETKTYDADADITNKNITIIPGDKVEVTSKNDINNIIYSGTNKLSTIKFSSALITKNLTYIVEKPKNDKPDDELFEKDPITNEITNVLTSSSVQKYINTIKNENDIFLPIDNGGVGLSNTTKKYKFTTRNYNGIVDNDKINPLSDIEENIKEGEKVTLKAKNTINGQYYFRGFIIYMTDTNGNRISSIIEKPKLTGANALLGSEDITSIEFAVFGSNVSIVRLYDSNLVEIKLIQSEYVESETTIENFIIPEFLQNLQENKEIGFVYAGTPETKLQYKDNQSGKDVKT
ncbi:MAG: hypothetical protein RR334_01975, partial [Clostridia bacterium]